MASPNAGREAKAAQRGAPHAQGLANTHACCAGSAAAVLRQGRPCTRWHNTPSCLVPGHGKMRIGNHAL